MADKKKVIKKNSKDAKAREKALINIFYKKGKKK